MISHSVCMNIMSVMRSFTCESCMSYCCVYGWYKNAISRPSSELLYSFPLDEPMATFHCDLYQPGKTVGFDGDHSEMIVCCHVTTFAASEYVK